MNSAIWITLFCVPINWMPACCKQKREVVSLDVPIVISSLCQSCWPRISDLCESWASFSWERNFDCNGEVRKRTADSRRGGYGSSWEGPSKTKESTVKKKKKCHLPLRPLILSQAFLEMKLQIQNKFYFFSPRQREGEKEAIACTFHPMF